MDDPMSRRRFLLGLGAAATAASLPFRTGAASRADEKFHLLSPG